MLDSDVGLKKMKRFHLDLICIEQYKENVKC